MFYRLISIACVVFLVAGCATPSQSAGTYSRRDAQTLQTVQQGTVLLIDDVLIDGEYTQLGTYGGAAVGYAAGRGVGNGDGRRIAGAVGAVGGAIAGQVIEKSVTTEEAFQIIVELDDGEVIAVVQATDIVFNEGERVRVLVSRGSGTARVLKM